MSQIKQPKSYQPKKTQPKHLCRKLRRKYMKLFVRLVSSRPSKTLWGSSRKRISVLQGHLYFSCQSSLKPQFTYLTHLWCRHLDSDINQKSPFHFTLRLACLHCALISPPSLDLSYLLLLRLISAVQPWIRQTPQKAEKTANICIKSSVTVCHSPFSNFIQAPLVIAESPFPLQKKLVYRAVRVKPFKITRALSYYYCQNITHFNLEILFTGKKIITES